MDTGTSQSTKSLGFLTWLEVNKKRLLTAGVALIVVIFAAVIFGQYQARKEQSASHELSEVRVPFSLAAVPGPEVTEALTKVANEHQGTQAGGRALLISAGIKFSQGTPQAYTEALQAFTRVTQDYPEGPWVPQAQLGIAASLAALGKTSEAIQKYEEIGRRYEKAGIATDAKLSLARLYEKQKPEEAFKIYDGLVQDTYRPDSLRGTFSMEADMNQKRMLKANPELAKLKAQPLQSQSSFKGTNMEMQLTPEMLSNAMQRAAASRGATNAKPAPAPAPAVSATNAPAATTAPK